jgi:intein/homing endonuclease
MVVNVDKGEKIKIEIDFIGNENYQIKLYVKTPNKKKLLSYTESIEIHKGKIQNRFRESDCLLKKRIETQEYFLIPLLILKMRTHCLSKLM